MTTYTAAYLRVSSSKQKTDSQRATIQKYIRDNRIKPVRWMQDKRTGRNTKRDSLQTILADCRNGTCKQILLYRLDRLARNTIETLEMFEELTTLGVRVVCVSQGLVFDNSATGTLMLTLWAALAQHESMLISERVIQGQAVAKKNGKHWGGSKPSKLKRLKLQRKLDAGKSIAECAAELGIARSSVYGMMQRMSA